MFIESRLRGEIRRAALVASACDASFSGTHDRREGSRPGRFHARFTMNRRLETDFDIAGVTMRAPQHKNEVHVVGHYYENGGGDVKIVRCQSAQLLVCNSAGGRKSNLSIFYSAEDASMIPRADRHEIPAWRPVIPPRETGALNALSLVEGHGGCSMPARKV